MTIFIVLTLNMLCNLIKYYIRRCRTLCLYLKDLRDLRTKLRTVEIATQGTITYYDVKMLVHLPEMSDTPATNQQQVELNNALRLTTCRLLIKISKYCSDICGLHKTLGILTNRFWGKSHKHLKPQTMNSNFVGVYCT